MLNLVRRTRATRPHVWLQPAQPPHMRGFDCGRIEKPMSFRHDPSTSSHFKNPVSSWSTPARPPLPRSTSVPATTTSRAPSTRASTPACPSAPSPCNPAPVSCWSSSDRPVARSNPPVGGARDGHRSGGVMVPGKSRGDIPPRDRSTGKPGVGESRRFRISLRQIEPQRPRVLVAVARLALRTQRRHFQGSTSRTCAGTAPWWGANTDQPAHRRSFTRFASASIQVAARRGMLRLDCPVAGGGQPFSTTQTR